MSEVTGRAGGAAALLAAYDEQMRPAEVANLPAGVDGQAYRWTDLHGDGTAGVLTQQADAWFYSRNLTPDADGRSISPLTTAPPAHMVFA